jgi:ActR/RegA family two-component response regulator
MLAGVQMRNNAPAVAVHLESVVSKPCEMAVDTVRCLVCMPDEMLRNAVARAAAEAGWSVVQAEDPAQAWSAIAQTAFHFVVIDLQQETSASVAGARELCEQLAMHSQRLLMVCGHEADPLQEVWARQLGAWLYVPGLSSDVSPDDLQGICVQAREAIERWQAEPVIGGD